MLFWHKKHIFLLILWNLHVFIFSEQLDYCLDYCLYGEFLWERKLSVVIYAELELYLLRANDYDLVSFCISFAFYINLLKKWIYLRWFTYLLCNVANMQLSYYLLTWPFLLELFFGLLRKLRTIALNVKAAWRQQFDYHLLALPV